MKRYPVLTLHSIDDGGSVISISPARFAGMMRSLAASGWRGCTLSEALSAWSDNTAGRRFGLSFDDGYRNLLAGAAPVLAELGFSATVFVIAARCGGDNRWPGQPSWVPEAPLLAWRDLRTLQAAGWEVGSHGLAHTPLTTLAPDEIARELETSRRLLEDGLGAPVPLFAYPYGEHDATVRRLTREHYDAAFGVRLAAATAADLAEPFRIPRIDAYYLRSQPASLLLDSLPGRAYLAARRWARRLRSAPIDLGALTPRR